MSGIRVTICGWDGFTCQIPRIKEGMKILGNILSYNSPDLIFCNDPSEFQKAIFTHQLYHPIDNVADKSKAAEDWFKEGTIES